MNTLDIKSGQGDYSVEFVDDLKELIDVLSTIPKAIAIIDKNVAFLYEDSLRSLNNMIPTMTIEATEEEKSWDGVSKVLTFLQNKNCTRQNILLAIGGGIIQDITSFAAHIYYRGIKWVFVPTTLLAMSDSCIGAKTGINFNSYKNQLGFFYSPMKVHISLKFLETLGEIYIISGYGEIFKLSLLGPIDCFKFLSDCIKKRGFHNPDIKDLIYQSLSIKKHVIEIDEYESDLRRILNYGHTFGHSLEAFSTYETPHGIAVAWGMDLANWISYKKGFLSKKDFMRIHELAEQFFSFRISKKFILKDLIVGTKRDKKVSEGKLSLILLEKPGKLRIVPTNFDENLEKFIAEYLNNYSIIKAFE